MPIIRAEQLGYDITKDPNASLPRQVIEVFRDARQLAGGKRQQLAVIEQIQKMAKEGTLRLTPILNEAEPFRTWALEYLTGMSWYKRVPSHQFQLSSVLIKHRGWEKSPPVKVVIERRPVGNGLQGRAAESVVSGEFGNDTGVRHMRIYGNWEAQQIVKLPYEQAIGTLFRFGWYVKPHISMRLRRKYRPLVELDPNGVPVMHDGSEEPANPENGKEHILVAADEAKQDTIASRNLKVPKELLK